MPRTHLGASRPLTRFSTVLIAVGLSLSIVTMTPRPAEASFLDAVPVTMGGAKVAAPLRVLTSATPAGLVANGIGILAVAAWETRDTWLPIAKDLFGGQSGSASGSSPYSTLTNFVRQADRPQQFSFQVHMFGTNNFTQTGSVTETTCYLPGAGTGLFAGAKGSMTMFTAYSPKQSPQLRVYTACGPGEVVKSATVRIDSQYHTIDFGWLGGKPEVGTITTTVQCLNPDGSTFEITGSLPAAQSRVPVPSCRAAGGIPNRIDTSTTQGGPTKPMFSLETDPGWLEQYGDCLRGATGPVCKVAVWIGGEPCQMGDLACVNWPDYAVRYPSRVECRLGSVVIAFGMCDVLKHSYVATPHVVTTPGPNGEPELNPEPPTNPDPENPTDPEGPPTPCVAGQPTCPNPVPPEVDPEVVDPNSNNCLGGAWTLNPVDWVYVPMKCAFIWAFVPKVELSTRVQAIELAFKDKPPFSWLVQLSNLPSAAAASGCPDWRVRVAGLDSNVVCNSSFTAAVRAARPFFAALMLTAAFWPLIRGLMFASVPLLKPVPTGKD